MFLDLKVKERIRLDLKVKEGMCLDLKMKERKKEYV